jgi:exodeoxyribonuclease V beta subunit
VPGYSFERHFGGVFYLFIKGMAPEHGAAGVFYEKPPIARVEALGRLLERSPQTPEAAPRVLVRPDATGAEP